MLLPWQFIRVDGPSMTPTLLPGDLVLVSHAAPVRVGAVVLARFRGRPSLLVVKRVRGVAAGQWLLASDNAVAGSDSRQHGPAEVLAVASWVLPGEMRHALARRNGGLATRVRHWLPSRIVVRAVEDL
jgi:Peptidase S24-like